MESLVKLFTLLKVKPLALECLVWYFTNPGIVKVSKKAFFSARFLIYQPTFYLLGLQDTHQCCCLIYIKT